MNNEIVRIVKRLCMEDSVPTEFFRNMAIACGYIVLDSGVYSEFDPDPNKRIYATPKILANEIENDYNDRAFLTQYFLNVRAGIDTLPEVLRTAIINSPEYKSLTKDGTRDAVSGAVAELWEHPKENGVILTIGENFDGSKPKTYFDGELLSKFLGSLKPKNNNSIINKNPDIIDIIPEK